MERYDAEQLRRLILGSADAILAHREKVVPSTSFTFEDEPTSRSTPGSKAPLSLGAVEAADLEAIALYDIAVLALELFDAKELQEDLAFGFWKRTGTNWCLGLRSTHQRGVPHEVWIPKFCTALSHYAEELAALPDDLHDYFSTLEKVRRTSTRINQSLQGAGSSVQDDWITLSGSTRELGIPRETVLNWVNQYGLDTSTYPGKEMLIERAALVSLSMRKNFKKTK